MSTITQRSSMGTINFSQMLAHEARLNGLHRLFKTHFNVPEPSLILEPYLFLGNCISAQDIYRLSRLGIRYILNVAKRDVELCPYYSKDMHVLTIDLRDDDRENILCIFDQAFAFIDEARKANSRVLVHCSHGQSRSPAIVIAYLMRTYHVSLEQCLTHVVKARPCVIPNDGFLKQLILFDRVLVERRRQQQNVAAAAAAAVALQTIKSTKSTEIPIQNHSPNGSQPVSTPISVKSIPSPSSDKTASKAVNITSVDISSMRLSSKTKTSSSSSTTSNIQASASTKSMQVIPIQISPKKERHSEKIKRSSSKKTSIDNTTGTENTNKKSDKTDKHATTKSSKSSSKPRLKTSSSHNELLTKKKSHSKKTTDIKPLSPPMQRSHTDNATNNSTVKSDSKPSLNIIRQQVNFSHYYPTHFYGSIGHIQSNYITEIYDRAAKRFIPTAACY